MPIAVTPAPPARRSSRSRRNPRYVDAASVFGLLLTLVTLAAAVRSIAHLLS